MRVIGLLSRPSGATIAGIMQSTGWQPHSVRGFLAAVVRAATTRLEFEGNSFPLHTAVRAVGAADLQLRAGLRPDLTALDRGRLHHLMTHDYALAVAYEIAK